MRTNLRLVVTISALACLLTGCDRLLGDLAASRSEDRLQRGRVAPDRDRPRPQEHDFGPAPRPLAPPPPPIDPYPGITALPLEDMPARRSGDTGGPGPF